MNQKTIPKFEEIEIDFTKAIIFLDIDGTIVSDREDEVHPYIQKKILEMKEKGNTVHLCTNSIYKKRNEKLEKKLGLKIINSRHKKPNKKILQEIGMTINDGKTFIVIGDKWLTDGLFSKNIRGRFIKVKRKSSGNENIFIKTLNFVDDLLYHVIANEQSK